LQKRVDDDDEGMNIQYFDLIVDALPLPFHSPFSERVLELVRVKVNVDNKWH